MLIENDALMRMPSCKCMYVCNVDAIDRFERLISRVLFDSSSGGANPQVTGLIPGDES